VSRRRPPTLRAARLSGGESFVFVECRREVVVVYPGQRRVAIDALNHSPAHNPLFQAVRQQLERRQARANPGEPALLRQYGVAPEASRKAVRALVAEGLAFKWRAAAPTSHRRDTHPPRLRTNRDPRQ